MTTQANQNFVLDFQSKHFAEDFFATLNQVGFAILKNHPINPNLVKDVFNQWAEFFNTPQKHEYEYNKKTLDGYFPFGLENPRLNKLPDLKEFFYYYPWGKCPENLRKITHQFYTELFQLGDTLLQHINHYLPVEIVNKLSMPLHQMIKNTPRAVLRILHYPPISNFNSIITSETVRAIEHEDLTLLSIIVPQGNGLQLKDVDGNWHEIENSIEELIINIGELLGICTQGYLTPTTHRVLVNSPKDAQYSRYANAFFLNPNDDVLLDDNKTAFSFLENHINKKLKKY